MKEEYGLEFYKVNLSDEIVNLVSQKKTGGDNSILTYISRLDKHDVEGFIYDLNKCMNGHTNAGEGFYSDSTEHMNIIFEYPNINLDGILIIPMSDMKELLEEWLAFISL